MRKHKLALLTLLACAALLALAGAVRVQAQTRAEASAEALTQAVAELHAILSSAGQAAPDAAAQSEAAGAGSGASPSMSVRRLMDGDEFMTVSVPAHWQESASGIWSAAGGEVGRYITAAPNLAAFRAGAGPGVFFGAAPRGTSAVALMADQPVAAAQALGAQALDGRSQRFAGCLRESARPYNDAFYAGAYDIVAACENDGSLQRVHVEAVPLTGQVAVTLRAITATQEDRDALAQVLRSFQVLDPSFSDRHGEEDHDHAH